jgi:hypothetical protein
MSYWSIANGTRIDQERGSSAGAAVVDALVAAKVTPEDAARIVDALSKIYTPRTELPDALEEETRRRESRNPLAKPPPAPTTGAAEQEDDEARNGGVPAVALDGRVFVNNNLNVAGNLAVNNLRVFQNAAIGNRLTARDAVFRTLAVQKAAVIGPGLAVFNAPIVANQAIVARQGGQFAGHNVFSGNVQLNGVVDWRGRVCNPETVVLTKSLGADGTAKVVVGGSEVRVLNDYGDAPPSTLEWTYEPEAQAVVQSVATEAITVITSVGFDAENCAVTSATTSIYSVVSITGGTAAATTGSIKINSV